MKKPAFVIPALLFLFVILSCERKAEQILPSRDGTWSLAKVVTQTSDSVRTKLDQGVFIFSKDGRGSYQNNSNHEINPIAWNAYQGATVNYYYVDLEYMDGTGDTISHVFTVQKSTAKNQEWQVSETNPKTGIYETIRWTLER